MHMQLARSKWVGLSVVLVVLCSKLVQGEWTSAVILTRSKWVGLSYVVLRS